LIRLQDGSAENGSEFLPAELFPLLLDFLSVDEVVMFDVQAVSGFFASPEGLGIPFVQGDGHRLSANIVL